MNNSYNNYPSRIYLETTTRCNLNCSMCVKHSSGSGMTEGDFNINLFPALEPGLRKAGTLILSGIGEPVLYANLEDLIKKARHVMPTDSTIGFQTNGMLINREKAAKLIDAGLDTICISLDSSNPVTYRLMRKGGDLKRVTDSFTFLKEASHDTGKKIQTGIEFVLVKENMHDLPGIIEFSARNGVTFIIVTHQIPYSRDSISSSVYDRNTDGAADLYEKTLKKYAASGVDITTYFNFKWKMYHTPEEIRIINAVETMLSEARDKGIFMNLKTIMEMDTELKVHLDGLFAECLEKAVELGIDLKLPAVTPAASKKCGFMENGSTFISWDGDVHPCHFLWHKFQCYVTGWRKFVNPRSFGNISEQSLLEIWNSPLYREFRETVNAYNYPVCSNCCFAPCDYIYSEKFEQDCYTNTIPCCDCQWCLGIFQCL